MEKSHETALDPLGPSGILSQQTTSSRNKSINKKMHKTKDDISSGCDTSDDYKHKKDNKNKRKSDTHNQKRSRSKSRSDLHDTRKLAKDITHTPILGQDHRAEGCERAHHNILVPQSQPTVNLSKLHSILGHHKTHRHIAKPCQLHLNSKDGPTTGHPNPLPPATPLPSEVPIHQVSLYVSPLNGKELDSQRGFRIQSIQCVGFREVLVDLLSLLPVPTGLLHVPYFKHTHRVAPLLC